MKRVTPFFLLLQQGQKILPLHPSFSPVEKWMTMCRAIHCTYCRSKAAAPPEEAEMLHSLPLNQSAKDDERNLDEYYSAEQRSVILQVLNTADDRELASVKLLRGKKSASIIEYRNKNGPFQDIQSLMNVPLLKFRSVVKVCHSILNPNERAETREKKSQLAKCIKPDVERERLESAKTIVSIVSGTRKIAWAHVDRGLNILDWQQEECHNFMRGTYQTYTYLEDILSVVSKIPVADIYILEKPGISAQNVNLFSVAVHLRTVEAMLYCLLSTGFIQDGQHRVLSMVRTAVGKHFDLMVAESRTSGAELVRQFMTDSVTQTNPRVTFPRDMVLRYRKMFQLGGRERAEEMCDALLQAVAFYEIVHDIQCSEKS
ncbi:transcription elongation factor, mitochondrial [Protopterus annectens]|uniref:transcription elongation factor, mitochondrial n=1 Tax=Protopterus annectens TaxID=7888 RepID=UPI001CFA2477|nr:transcription elongation factor, mitochondrial [Protopterus annectens]